MAIYKAENLSEVDFYEKLNGDSIAYCNLGNYDISTLLINISFFYKSNHGIDQYFINMRGTNSRCLAIGYSENGEPIGIYRDSLYDSYSHLWDDRDSVSYYSENNIVTNSLSPLSLSLNGTQYNSGSNNISSESIPVKTHGDVHYIILNNNYLYPCKLKGLLSSEFAWDNQPHYADECGMWDSINNIFYGNANSEGAFTVSGDKIRTISAKKKISYLAYAISNNQLIYPKKVYFANSNNTLKLVYARPIYDLHIVNLAINTKLGNADKVSEIKFTNNLLLQKKAYNNNIVDVTFNHFKTVEFLVQNQDNDTFTCYIANAFYGESSKVYCYGDFNRCFMNCSILTTIPVSNFETSNVTSMFMFFEACTNATTIDVSNFNTSNVTSMSCMFRDCRNVTELNVSNFNTSRLTNIAWMFTECNSVTELDVSKFDTSRCTSMYALFQSCNKITELDVSNFDTSKVTSMYAMFSGCKELKSLDVSKFDTSKVTNMQFMFTGLFLIKRLDISNFSLSRVTNLGSFVRYCYELEYLKLPILNTLNAIQCGFMFFDNPKIISLNLDGFSTNNCKSIIYLFNNNSSLRRIFTNTFDTSSLEYSDPFQEGQLRPGDFDMFSNCKALKGGNGTTYNVNHIDSEYARIDGENGLPGYFTDPAYAIKITLINVDNEGYTDEIYLCAGDTYTIPTLQGYTAVVTDNNGNSYSDGDTITINQDITLTFVWTAVNNNE